MNTNIKGKNKMSKKIKIATIVGSVVAVVACVAIILAVVLGNKGFRVISVEDRDGDVSVARSGSILDAVEGMKLIDKDGLHTGESAYALLLLDEDKHIIVEEKTDISIEATGTEEAGKVLVNLEKGKAEFTVDNKLNEDSTFEVQTPNALLAIRGTSFTVDYDDNDDSTAVRVKTGVVNVKFGDQDIDLNPDESVIIKDDGYITVPSASYVLEVTYDIFNPNYINTGHYNESWISFRNIDKCNPYDDKEIYSYYEIYTVNDLDPYFCEYYGFNDGRMGVWTNMTDFAVFGPSEYIHKSSEEIYGKLFKDDSIDIWEKLIDENDKGNTVMKLDDNMAYNLTFYGLENETINLSFRNLSIVCIGQNAESINYDCYSPIISAYGDSYLYGYTIEFPLDPRMTLQLIEMYDLEERMYRPIED